MTPNAPWTDRIFELIADGPRPLEFLIAEVRNTVPPGRAYRRAVRKRDRVRTSRVNKTDRTVARPKPTEDETIRVGQRAIVMDSITNLVRRGRLEYIDANGVKSVGIVRARLPSGMAASKVLAILRQHEPTYSKRRLDGIRNNAGHPIDAIDITCSCGWTYEGAERISQIIGAPYWEVFTTSRYEAEKEFTKHRRSFV